MLKKNYSYLIHFSIGILLSLCISCQKEKFKDLEVATTLKQADVSNAITLNDSAKVTISIKKQYNSEITVPLSATIAIWKADSSQLTIQAAESILQGKAFNDNTQTEKNALILIQSDVLTIQNIPSGRYFLAVLVNDPNIGVHYSYCYFNKADNDQALHLEKTFSFKSTKVEKWN